MFFPSLVGLVAGAGQHLDRDRAALAAGALAVLVVGGVATRRPWRRRPSHLADERPLIVRFSTWLITALLLPNLLHGLLILTREGPPPDYLATAAVAMLASAIHGAAALTDRLRRRRPPSA